MTFETLLSKPCAEASAEKLSEDQLDGYMSLFTEWEIDEDGMLVTNFELENFDDALDLLNQVAALASAENHHPDLLLHNYKFIGVILHTTSAEGLTEKDFALAAKIDSMFSEN